MRHCIAILRHLSLPDRVLFIATPNILIVRSDFSVVDGASAVPEVIVIVRKKYTFEKDIHE